MMDRQRHLSTASYFPSPVPSGPTTPNVNGTFLDDMSRRDPSYDLPRLTEDEVAEIIAEGPSIRARMERHKIDVDFVLECNSMLLEWVAMRERLLRQWHRVPAELIAPPAMATSPKTPTGPRPHLSPLSVNTALRSPETGKLRLSPLVGALLHRKSGRSLRDRAAGAMANSHLMAGLTKRIKPRRKECSCPCTCGGMPMPTTSLKFDDDAVVVIDLHAELIRYDELLRGLKERFDNRDGVDIIADEDEDEDHDGRYSPDSIERGYDDAYEADEESIVSPVVQRHRIPPIIPPPNPRYPWRIPEAPEVDDDEENSGDDTETEPQLSLNASCQHSSTVSSPTTPRTDVLESHHLDHLDRLDHFDTHRVDHLQNHRLDRIDRHRYATHSSQSTVGVLSDAMARDARSIVGSAYTADTFGLRSFTSAGDFGSIRSFPLDVGSYGSAPGGIDREFHLMLNQMSGGSVFDESALGLGSETKDGRERALGGDAQRAIRYAGEMRHRTVTEFGVRTRRPASLATSTPYPTPSHIGEGHQIHTTVATIPDLLVAADDTALGGHTILTFSSKDNEHGHGHEEFHPMEQFADASTAGSKTSSAKVPG